MTRLVHAFVAAVLSASGTHYGPAPSKHAICGLLSMGRLAFLETGEAPRNDFVEPNAHPDVYVAAVITLSWAQLEPADGVLDLGPLEQALTNLHRYNLTHRKPMNAKLRVFAGTMAPPWAKALEGGPLAIADRDRTVTIGRFWSSPYRSKWRAFQTMLAGHLDTDPAIAEVAVTSCSTVTGEPFVIPLTRSNDAVLHSAGFSDRDYKSCLEGAIDDYAAWRRTPLDFTFNPFRDSDSAHLRPDPEFTVGLMRRWRGALGNRGVIANHGLVAPLRPAALSIYAELANLGPPLEFQLVAPAIDASAAIKLALTYHPTEIELYDSIDAGGHASYSAEQLRAWSSRMPCGRGGAD